MLVFAATGTPPFGTGSTAALIYRVVHSPPSLDDVPPEVLPLAERCLAKDPGQRPVLTDLLAELGDADLEPTWPPVRVLEGFAPHAPPDPASTDSPPRYVPTDRVIQASSREPAPGAPRTAAGADGPSSPADVLTVGQRVRPGPGLGNDGALSARRPRRRLLAIALACAIFTAAGLVPFVLPSTPGSPSSPGSPGHRHVAIGSLAATNCGGQGCAIAYSSVQQRPYFGSAPTGSNNGDGQIDVGVIAQAAALTKCYNSGATDCDVAVWAINGAANGVAQVSYAAGAACRAEGPHRDQPHPPMPRQPPNGPATSSPRPTLFTDTEAACDRLIRPRRVRLAGSSINNRPRRPWPSSCPGPYDGGIASNTAPRQRVPEHGAESGTRDTAKGQPCPAGPGTISPTRSRSPTLRNARPISHNWPATETEFCLPCAVWRDAASCGVPP